MKNLCGIVFASLATLAMIRVDAQQIIKEPREAKVGISKDGLNLVFQFDTNGTLESRISNEYMGTRDQVTFMVPMSQYTNERSHEISTLRIRHYFQKLSGTHDAPIIVLGMKNQEYCELKGSDAELNCTYVNQIALPTFEDKMPDHLDHISELKASRWLMANLEESAVEDLRRIFPRLDEVPKRTRDIVNGRLVEQISLDVDGVRTLNDYDQVRSGVVEISRLFSEGPQNLSLEEKQLVLDKIRGISERNIYLNTYYRSRLKKELGEERFESLVKMVTEQLEREIIDRLTAANLNMRMEIANERGATEAEVETAIKVLKGKGSRTTEDLLEELKKRP